MAFPPQYREPPPELPSIRTPGADPFRASHYQDVPFSRSPAVSIPGVEHRVDAAPPPLPPPRILPFEGAPDMREKRDYDHSFPSSGSGYGSMDSALDDRPVLKRRDTASTNGDEGYASYSTDRSRESFPSEFGLFHTKLQLPSPADRHSDSMKKKLDPIRTSDPKFHMSDARFSPSVAVPMQLPIHSRPPMHDSPVRLLETPYSAVSPRSHPYSHWPSGPRSPQEMTDPSRSPHGRSTRHNSDDATSTHGSYGYHSAEDMEIDDTSSHKRLHMESGQDNSRSKRRAPSPQTAEERNRQQLESAPHWGSHGSPTRRRGPILQGSHSSQMRSESYMNMTPSDSYGRRSPDGMSTGSRTRNSSTSPYNAAISLTHSPQSSVSNHPPVHARAVSGSDSRAVNDVQKTTGPKLQGFLMCECCPKKPRKFDTAEELKAHAAEKQYGCNYCANRFKNKNEAERHQNSLHVRRHSWSCSALSGYDRAFHESTTRPGEADTCGYCGEEFARSGRGPGSGALSGGVPPRHASEQDWEERIRHLQEVHKFRECNSSKKFYRADHFRQHLKHSHAGTSGKWTNMLENACMLEEDPTPR